MFINLRFVAFVFVWVFDVCILFVGLVFCFHCCIGGGFGCLALLAVCVSIRLCVCFIVSLVSLGMLGFLVCLCIVDCLLLSVLLLFGLARVVVLVVSGCFGLYVW